MGFEIVVIPIFPFFIIIIAVKKKFKVITEFF